jgi:nitrogen regulatory protein PII
MELFPRRMVTIVTESALERELIAELEGLGVHGFTISDVRGKGSRGTRRGEWAPAGNIRIEVVCDQAAAERIAELVRDRYYDHYAMILYVQDVSVLRPEKF